MTESYSPWQSKNVLSGTVPLAPASDAQLRVLAALEDIAKFDSDRAFVVAARARYIDITNQLVPTNQNKPDSRRADGGCHIVMKHAEIAGN